ncbi:MAG: yacP [Firmicutes bacterium]|nr:yacP [Bacillota bacterium]
MADFMLVDGYNVINAWPELVALIENLDYARDRLVDILSGYGAYKEYRIVIVFDAHAVAGESTIFEVRPKWLEVVFTKEGETADSYIEKKAYQLVRQGEVVHVVTSDRAEQLTVLGMGAWRISVRELLNEVLAIEKCLREDYGESVFNHRRQEIGGRVGRDIMEKLDEMRRRG